MCLIDIGQRGIVIPEGSLSRSCRKTEHQLLVPNLDQDVVATAISILRRIQQESRSLAGLESDS